MGACKSKSQPQQQTRSVATQVDLSNITLEDTKEYIPKINKCVVVKVYDGDTITIATTVGDDPTIYRFNVRFSGIDCPEMAPAFKNTITGREEKEIAIKARDFLSDMILGKYVDLSEIGIEKYGRLLATVRYNGENMNELMLKKRFAVVYNTTYPRSWKRYYETGNFE